MKRYIQTVFTLLICCCALCFLHAQEDYEIPAEIKWGEFLKEPNNSYVSKVIGTRPEGIYTLREKGKGSLLQPNQTKIYLERYDRNMNLSKGKEIVLKYKNKNLDFEDVIMLNGKIFLFSSFNNQAKKKNYLFTQEVSLKSLLPRRSMQMIGEIDTRNKAREGSFDYHISSDSTKILIFNQLPYKKKQPERFALRVFDDSFLLLWEKEIQLPYNDESFAVEEYRVDNEGNVYLLGVIYEDHTRYRRQGKPTYQYTILAYKADGTEVEEYKIDLEDKFITDLTFRSDNKGNLVCSGFYSDRGTYSIKGTYFFRVDTKTKQIFNQNMKTFDFDFVTEYLSDKKKEKLKTAEAKGNVKKTPELYQYDLDRLILRSDGGALLIAEQYYVQERTYRDNFYSYNPYFYNDYRNMQSRDFIYHYNDIIVVNITPTGEIEWVNRIPKRQTSFNDGGYYSSYSMAVIRDKLYFVYNDNGRNYDPDRREDRIYNFDGKNSIISLAEIKRNGDLTLYPLFSNSDADVITRPKVCEQIGKREMVIYGEWGRRYRFAKLSFL